MKKASVMSTVSMVIYISSLFIHLVGKAFNYIPWIKEGYGPLILRDVLFLGAPLILGSLLLIFGVKLAAKNKARAVYSIGFLLLMIPFILNIISSVSLRLSLLIALVSALTTIIALLLLALDNFIRPRVKVMGILGAALMWLTMTVALINDIFQATQSIGVIPNITGPIAPVSSFLSHIGYRLIAVAALLFVIGRPSRAGIAAPAPQPVNPPYGYRQQQMPQYAPPRPAQYPSPQQVQYPSPQQMQQPSPQQVQEPSPQDDNN